ncbi:hypothetical protein [Clostridioides sp. ZZV14-5902]|uniref:hypothetical protein n=1 Tax=Clostridioides sp. ZZV14-5902 TaxID=2811486 RepID=UPI001D12BA50|nr:hypothetical protein [Clostridioides sp. ZZV14-5902]
MEKMASEYLYDFIANRNIKIGVKVSNLYKNEKTEYHCFELEEEYHSCDIYILVALDGAESALKILIIPTIDLMGQRQLIIEERSRYDKFDSRFELIKIYDNFYNDLDCVI